MAPNNRISANNHQEQQDRTQRNLERFLNSSNNIRTQLRQQQQQQQQQQQHNTRRVTAAVVSGRSISFTYGPSNPPPSWLDRAVELLDPALRPIPPQPGCQQSMRIYNDHRKLAANYLDVKDKQSELQQYKQELQSRLDCEESPPDDGPLMVKQSGGNEQREEELKKYLQIQQEKEDLEQYQAKLSNQLQLIKRAKGGRHRQRQQQQQQQQQHPEKQHPEKQQQQQHRHQQLGQSSG